jgi:hypothetical protein
MCAKDEWTVSKPVGEEQVVPTTRFKESRERSGATGRVPRNGDRPGRGRWKGELDGVSLSRLFEGVDAIVSPLASQKDGYDCTAYAVDDI